MPGSVIFYKTSSSEIYLLYWHLQPINSLGHFDPLPTIENISSHCQITYFSGTKMQKAMVICMKDQE